MSLLWVALRPAVTIGLLGLVLRIPIWLQLALAGLVAALTAASGLVPTDVTWPLIAQEAVRSLAVAAALAGPLLAVRMSAGALADVTDEPALTAFGLAIAGLAYAEIGGPGDFLAALLASYAVHPLAAPVDFITVSIRLAMPFLLAALVLHVVTAILERTADVRLPALARALLVGTAVGSILVMAGRVATLIT